MMQRKNPEYTCTNEANDLGDLREGIFVSVSRNNTNVTCVVIGDITVTTLNVCVMYIEYLCSSITIRM